MNHIDKGSIGSISRSRIFYLLLFIIAIRPMINLFGRMEGGGINVGGVYGILLAALIMIIALFDRNITLRSCGQVYFAVSILLLIILLHLVMIIAGEPYSHKILIFMGHLAISGSTTREVELARFVVGFSTVMLPIMAVHISWDKAKQSTLFFQKYLIISCLTPIVILLLQYMGQYKYSYFDTTAGGRIFGRPTGGYFQPALICMTLIPVIIISYAQRMSGLLKRTINHYSIVGVCLISIFLSTHRTSLFIAVLSISYMEFHLAGRSIRRLISLSYVILTLIILSLIAPDLGMESETYNVIVRGFDTIFTESRSGAYFRGRSITWMTALQTYEDLDPLSKIFGTGYQPMEPHNDFLRVLIVNGFVGLLAYLLFFVSLFIWVASRVNKSGKVILRTVYLMLFTYAIPLQPTITPTFMWLFFSIITICLILFGNKMRSSADAA